MIPVFSHCQDCGNPPVPVTSLWTNSDAVLGWWCSVCKLVLLDIRE